MCSASAYQINPLPNANLDNGRKRSDYREMRARAVVAMAPPGATLFTRRQGIESIKIPVLLLQGEQDMLLKYPNDARFFKSATRAEHHIVPGDHFVFMSINPHSPSQNAGADDGPDTLSRVHALVADFLMRALP
ncbi:alpha/beta hydrolase [Verminephrobacter eiseniae]|nr:alpha/beta hydrolase [Verminephrobacter eiseniae]MCW5304187.1 alpha/beta hydrolase [Verminephrobacter eiseniae]MCW8179423.1 alpha/beta hydrolase [Verminephrobacter eiseniae]MCW8191319.1 alpha/beta hydrolase [Verminephrobacter eiseniae]